MKIAHAADIHIRGLKYREEMMYTIERFCEALDQHGAEGVVIPGDTYHSKLTVTSEYFSDCYTMFYEIAVKRNLPTVIIPGNHDLAVNNPSRMDAISPVVKAIQPDEENENNNIFYEKFSGLIRAKGFDGIDFYHMSCLDKRDMWPKNPVDESKINIALYHGSINGSVVDSGWVSRGNKDELGIFDNFDFAFLGDIHKHQFLDEQKKIAYPGSLRQNNYGEDLEKGFILWDIRGKDDFSSEFVVLPQKRYFFTLYLSDANDVPLDLDLPEDSRIRVKCLGEKLTPAQEVKVKNELEMKYKPYTSIKIIPPDFSVEKYISELEDSDIFDENIRDEEVQKRLIENYLEDQNIDGDVIEEVLSIDKKYHSYIDTNLIRNVVWKPKSFEWNNLFSYGKGNKLDFEKLKGIIGIFGKNGIGKTSIFDSMSYTISNKINKEGANKNAEYVNTRCKNALGKFMIECGDNVYQIIRETKKRKTKSGELKASNFVDFSIPKEGDSGILNGEKVTDTNKEIEKIFGDLNDLNEICLVPQFRLTSIVDAKKTERKKTYAKIMDLGVFEYKHSIANEDFKKIKAMAETLNEENLTEKLHEANENLSQNSESLGKYQKVLNEKIKSLESLKNEILDLSSELRGFTKDDENIEDLTSDLQNTIDEIEKCNSIIKSRSKTVEELKLLIEGRKKEEVEKTIEDDKSIKLRHEKMKSSVTVAKRKLGILGKIPGVKACKTCALVEDAYQAQTEVGLLESELANLEKEFLSDSEIRDYKKILEAFSSVKHQEAYLENFMLKLDSLKIKREELEKRVDEYKGQEELIDLRRKLSKYKIEESSLNNEIETISSKVSSLNREAGKLEERISTIEEKIKESKKLNDEYYYYQLYLQTMGKDGIAYTIISKMVPFVEQEVNNILSQIVEFKLVIENKENEKSINYYIVDKNHGRRSVELSSGMQKTIVSVAIRAALWKVCSLPKPNFIMLDEPFGALDANNYDSMINLLEYLKNYYDHIFVISHNEDLKTSVDSVLYVKKKANGYAHVEK